MSYFSVVEKWILEKVLKGGRVSRERVYGVFGVKGLEALESLEGRGFIRVGDYVVLTRAGRLALREYDRGRGFRGRFSLSRCGFSGEGVRVDGYVLKGFEEAVKVVKPDLTPIVKLIEKGEVRRALYRILYWARKLGYRDLVDEVKLCLKHGDYGRAYSLYSKLLRRVEHGESANS